MLASCFCIFTGRQTSDSSGSALDYSDLSFTMTNFSFCFYITDKTGEQSVLVFLERAQRPFSLIDTNESVCVFFPELYQMPYFADSCKIMMFALVFIKPRATVVGTLRNFPLLQQLFLSLRVLSLTNYNCPCCNADGDMTGGHFKLRRDHSNVIEEHQETRTKK
jgi:hypothetical protein